jgi:hypothetical protein
VNKLVAKFILNGLDDTEDWKRVALEDHEDSGEGKCFRYSDGGASQESQQRQQKRLLHFKTVGVPGDVVAAGAAASPATTAAPAGSGVDAVHTTCSIQPLPILFQPQALSFIFVSIHLPVLSITLHVLRLVH